MKSKIGEIQTIEHWQEHCNSFYEVFERNRSAFVSLKHYPSKPADAWERYVKLLGLEECNEQV